MSLPRTVVFLVSWLALNAGARAGLYYSGETQNELPSQWRGYLLDQRTLRGIGLKPAAGVPANTARAAYEVAASTLDKLARQRRLTADELADLGALYVRLGDPAKAV